MTIETLANSIPEYAKDLKLNLTSMIRTNNLSAPQLWGALVTAAITSRNKTLSEEILEEAKSHLDEAHYLAAHSAASIMGMNNIYYRFLHLTSNETYQKMPAKLRMNSLRGHGIDQGDFELWSLVASAMTGCAICVDSHEKALKEHGFSDDQILEGVRIAAIINGISIAISAGG